MATKKKIVAPTEQKYTWFSRLDGYAPSYVGHDELFEDARINDNQDFCSEKELKERISNAIENGFFKGGGQAHFQALGGPHFRVFVEYKPSVIFSQ